MSIAFASLALAFSEEEKGLPKEHGRTELYSVSSIENPILHKELISCLSQFESQNNQQAVGQAGEIGILQFLPSTWEAQIKKYDMEYLDINSAHDQQVLADTMLSANTETLVNWTTRFKCLHYL